MNSSVHWAPLGTTIPTTAYGGLDGFRDCGTLLDARFEHDVSSSDVYSWGGSLIGTIQDRYHRTIRFSTLDTTWHASPWLTETSTWVFDNMPTVGRIVVPIGRIVAIGGGGDVQLKAFPDENNNQYYRHEILTWEETWTAYVGACLEGDTANAATLLSELSPR